MEKGFLTGWAKIVMPAIKKNKIRTLNFIRLTDPIFGWGENITFLIMRYWILNIQSELIIIFV
jgi:hypothetical protein